MLDKRRTDWPLFVVRQLSAAEDGDDNGSVVGMGCFEDSGGWFQSKAKARCGAEINQRFRPE
jgi:hypothetical protein